MWFVIQSTQCLTPTLMGSNAKPPTDHAYSGLPGGGCFPLRATLYGLSEGGFVILFVILNGIKCGAPLRRAILRPRNTRPVDAVPAYTSTPQPYHPLDLD